MHFAYFSPFCHHSAIQVMVQQTIPEIATRGNILAASNRFPSCWLYSRKRPKASRPCSTTVKENPFMHRFARILIGAPVLSLALAQPAASQVTLIDSPTTLDYAIPGSVRIGSINPDPF